jgi:phosphate/sulfate permease
VGTAVGNGIKMADDYVTRAELNSAIIGLEQRMDKGFADLAKQISDLGHQLENSQHENREKNDDRYLLREESMGEAIERLANPRFRQACYPIVAEYLDTPDGRIKTSCIIDRHFAEKRDSTSKWINFIKMIGGILLAIGLIGGGHNIIKTNQQTQKAVIELLQKGE